VDETAAGQTFACPACQGSVVVPASQPTRTSGLPPSSTAGRSSAVPTPPSSAGRSSAAPPPPSSSGKSAAPPPPSGSGGSAPPPPSGSTLPPPSAEGEALAPEDAVMDEPEHGSYSAGFLAQTIDNKMAQLRGTTNSFFLGISSQNYKFAGDICLLVVAVLWLGTSAWDEFKGDEAESGGDGDAVEMAEKAEEDSKKKEEDAATAAIFAKTIKPLFQERCYECHKGEGAKSKLDLSLFEDDDAAGLNGIFSAINKGNSGQSTLLQRIKDTNDPMPPEGKGEMFTAEQADELAKWIDAGAPVPEPSFDSDKIVSIVTMLFKGILPIAFILILHYLTGVLFNAGDALIKSTPSRLSASGLMKAMALVVLLSGIAAAAAGIVYGVLGIMDGFSDNWLSVLAKIGGGVLLYLFCASLARLWLKPAQLNIKIGAGNTAGDEALGIMAMFSKTMLKIAPILYGMALIFCLLFALMNLVAKDDIESAASPAEAVATEVVPTEVGLFKSMSNLTKETLTDAISYFKESPLPVAKKYLDKGSVLKMAIKIPVYLFAYFLFSYVLVEALRALFSLPGRRSS
jgi:hypothetical protein